MSATRNLDRRKRRVRATAERAQRKIVVDFPEALFQETESCVAELATSRSNFIREAVARYIRERRRQKLEEELIEGYTANAEIARQVAEELSQFD
jgi:metal-responsive CopG/Arc/MetJ family transcriptional regulator